MKVELHKVRKVFGSGTSAKVAVDDVSWAAGGGEIFGLLGPNGAGKTTMIRMMLDIIRPDSGTVLIDGDPQGARTAPFKRRLGYLPEERGLYQKRKVIDVLQYFGLLRGMPVGEARRRALALLERFDLATWSSRRIEDLSKGMSQKVQIAACIIHDPEMVVLDEPFSGLDPVNVRIVREIIQELKRQDKLVFLSTHMMSEVEALCDRIFMIHHGRQVLYGNLQDIKRSYTDHEVLVDAEAAPEDLSCVLRVTRAPHGKYVHLRAGCDLHDFLEEMARHKKTVRLIQEASTPIEDIFVSLVQREHGRDGQDRGDPRVSVHDQT